MQITGLSPTRFDLPGVAEPVYIATQQWGLGRSGPRKSGGAWAERRGSQNTVIL